MNAAALSANVKYAVIRISSEPIPRGRLVLAYRDEQSLRNLIAEPSIVACGLAPETAAAVAGSLVKSSVPGRTKQEQRTDDGRRCDPGFASPGGQATVLSGWTLRGFAYSGVQFAFASAILAIYSKSLLSSIIRTFLGI